MYSLLMLRFCYIFEFSLMLLLVIARHGGIFVRFGRLLLDPLYVGYFFLGLLQGQFSGFHGF